MADLGIFKDVLVCDVSKFLLSESALRKQGFNIETQEPSDDKIVRDCRGQHVLTAKFNGRLWPVKVPVSAIYQVSGGNSHRGGAKIFPTATYFLVGGKPQNRAQAAHEKMDHVSYDVIKMTNQQGHFTSSIPRRIADLTRCRWHGLCFALRQRLRQGGRLPIQ